MSNEPNVRPNVSADPALPASASEISDNKALPSNLPIEPEMPGTEKSGDKSSPRHINLSSFPTDLKSLINTTDDTIVRLNKVLRAPGGLQAFLSTTNYGLYILAHLHATSPSRAQLLARLATYLGRTPPKTPVTPSSASLDPAVPASPLLPLALTIGDFRTTLRLTGLIPLYVLLKSLIRSSEPDRVLYTVKLVQCLGYIGFQALENVAHLTNKAIVSANWTNARFARLGGQAQLVTWSCRAWLVAITCDFLRLAREAQLARQTGSYARLSAAEKKDADTKWWSELFVSTSWYPMAWHYSVEGGIGLNLGMVGACGFLANVGNFVKAWDAAK